MTDIKHLERCFVLYMSPKNANLNKSEPQTYQNSPNPEDRHQSLARMGGWDSQPLLLGSECVLILKGSKSV